MDLAHRIALGVISAAGLFTSGFLLHHGWQVTAVLLAGLGTFTLGILAAAQAD